MFSDVARHYAKFLASVDVLPGDKFEEITGAKLGNDGVPGAKKIVEDTLKAGGGCIFIDEAYQLTSGHNPGGASVLDCLLVEMENHVGKLVFLLTGYNKQMEKFFDTTLDSRAASLTSSSSLTTKTTSSCSCLNTRSEEVG